MSNDKPENHKDAEEVIDEEELEKAYEDCDDDFVPFDKVEERTCEFENHANGVVTHGDSGDWPVIEALIADVN